MPDERDDLVQHRTVASQAIVDAAHLPRTLMGGTRAMRQADTKYLPKWPLEDALGAYAARKNQSFLFNGYKRAWMTVIGKAFAQGVVLSEDVPTEIRGDETSDGWIENVDLSGQHLDTFAQHVFGDSLHTGIGHILVDFPVSEGARTRAEERQMGLRPYWSYVPAENVLGWRSQRINGVETLTQVRIRETAEESAGEFGSETVERIRVLRAGDPFAGDESRFASWQLWRRATGKDGSERWEIEEDGAGLLRPLTTIPLVTFYARRVGFMQGRPALESLAWQNLEHWQSGSEQRNIMHWQRVPFYFFSGMPREDIDKFRGVGGGAYLHTESEQASAEVIEVSGAAAEAGERDLQRIRQEMEVLSLEPLLNRPTGSETATARALDEVRANASLAAWAANFEDALEQALGLTAEWAGLDGGGSARLTRDFGIDANAAEKAKVIQVDRQRGDISRRSYWEQMVELGVYSDDFDADVEEERLSQQGPALSSFRRLVRAGEPGARVETAGEEV